MYAEPGSSAIDVVIPVISSSRPVLESTTSRDSALVI